MIEFFEAHERFKPKRPMAILNGKHGVCPCCESLVSQYEISNGEKEIPHCKWCGQALDWSEENEKEKIYEQN